MASHDVALKVATELPVGAVDLEIPVKRNGRKIGTFTVNANGVSWNPATAKAATSVTWEDLPAALAGTATAPAPAAAKKTSAPAQKTAATKTSAPAQKATTATTKTAAPAKKTTARKTAGKKAAPAPAPAAVEETPAPAAEAPAAAPAKKATAKKAAKKSAPSTAAVDARAVREWAATQGIAVAPRGPISSTIIDQFRAAQ